MKKSAELLTQDIVTNMMTRILLFLGVIPFIYILAVKPYSYWKKKNVPTGRIIPLFGDFFSVVLRTQSYCDMIQNLYNKLPDARYMGIYEFRTPVLIVKSPELIKNIFVKDFDHFLNHRIMISKNVDELWAKGLVELRGQEWKSMRALLTPSFTPSKIKSMFALICNHSDLFIQHILMKNKEIVEIEFRETVSKFVNDSIASCASGIHVNSLEDTENEIYKMGKEASGFLGTPRKTAVFMLHQMFPSIMCFLRISVFGSKITKFFTNMVIDTIKMRKEKSIVRQDFLGLLIESKREGKKEHSTDGQDLTVTDIAAQVFIFFLSGFETLSGAISFMAYELAVNPDVQKRLIEEIDENKPLNGTPSYETVVNMTYMDMVLSESLRKWPTAVGSDRVATKPYVINPELPGEKPVHLDLDQKILVPIYAIHHDPRYYANPEKFDPERFSPYNRKNINVYTYLPFGIGPRDCIGSKFALVEIKVLFFYLLSNFEIVPVEETNIPLKIDKTSIVLNSVNGFPLGLKRRS